MSTNRFSPVAIGVSMAVAALGGASSVALATVTTVEITGSKIRQVDTETSQPVFTMSAEDIKNSGSVTLGELLNNMTTAAPPDFSRGYALASNVEAGGQYVSLRGLGANRVLILVDGRRWTSTADGYSDLSTVPAAMIERLEILRDGASAIYGSDAIAGVVNVILKRSMDGGSASAYTGRNRAGDGQTEEYTLGYGINGKRGSLMLGITHSKQGEVWAKDRAETQYSYGTDPTRIIYGLGTGAYGRVRQVTNNANGTVTARGFDRVINHNGSFLGDGVTQDVRDPNNYHTRSASLAADLFNPPSQMMFYMPSETTSVMTKGRLVVNEDTALYASAMFSERNSKRQVAGYPMNSMSQSTYPVVISKDSYYNAFGEDLFFYRRTIEIPRVTSNRNQTVHLDFGLEGDFKLAGNPWTYNAGFNLNRVSGLQQNSGNLNLVNLRKALGPSFLNAAGKVVCGTPGKEDPTCVPFNIVGGPSASTPEALAYVNVKENEAYGATVSSLLIDVTGPLVKLPAGPLAVAAGLERRKVSGYETPGQMSQLGLTTDLAGKPTDSEYTVNEGYVEANIPLLKNAPLAQSLSVNLAGRRSDYTNFGETTNGKASFVWRPVRDFMARGTVSEGFRAPTVGDSFGGGSQSFDTYLDPCDSLHGAAAKSDAGKARCAADGVSPTFRQVNQVGNVVGAGGGQTPYAFDAGAGNDSLQPETALTKTLGFVFSPSKVPNFSMSADWYDIEVKDRIAAVSASYVLGQCYTFGVTEFCDDFKRDGTGQVSSLKRGNLNLGQIQVKGYDVEMRYRFDPMSIGQITLSSQTSIMSSYKIQSTSTATPTEYVGAYGYPRMKTNVAANWTKGEWSATWGTRIIGSQKAYCWDPAETDTCSDPDGDFALTGGAFDRTGVYFYNDVSVGYKPYKTGQIQVGLKNVFNVRPQVVLDASYAFGGNSTSSSVDPDLPLDRFFWVRYTHSF